MLLQQSIEHVSIVYTCYLFCNTLVHVIYSGVSGRCSHTIAFVTQNIFSKVKWCKLKYSCNVTIIL